MFALRPSETPSTQAEAEPFTVQCRDRSTGVSKRSPPSSFLLYTGAAYQVSAELFDETDETRGHAQTQI